jgi:hypothetical protein
VPVALVALVLLGGTMWWNTRTAATAPAVTNGGTSTTTRPGAASAAPSAVPGAHVLAAARAGSAGDLQVPSAPPAGVSWRVWRTIAMPYSADAGPARVEGDVASGFARTPVGALLAAVQASSRKAAAGEPGWRDVALRMLAPGAGRDAWIAARGRVQHPDVPGSGTFAQVSGFQFVSWTATDAVVQLASRNPDGSFGVVTLHLAWVDGDWRLVLAPDGGDASSKQRAASLAGFVAWGGV